MDGFVIVVKSDCPDALLKLYPTRQEAEAFASAVSLEEVKRIMKESGCRHGVRGVVSLLLVEFRHGLLIWEDVIREFDEYVWSRIVGVVS
jgi:hypothetical protein